MLPGREIGWMVVYAVKE